jgi:hypothetical protein
MNFIITAASGENSDSNISTWLIKMKTKIDTYTECYFWPMFVGLLEAMVASHCAYWKLYGLQVQTEDGISRGFKGFSRPIWGSQMQIGHKAWSF